MKALVIGGSSWDTLIHVSEIKELLDDITLWSDKVIETVGGTGAGKALCLDILDVDTTLVTTIGNDVAGKQVLGFFNDTGIHVLPLEVPVTTKHTNIMHGKGNRISVFTSHSSEVLDVDERVIELIKEADVVFLNINEFCRPYVEVCKKYASLVVVDIHDYDPPNPYHQDFIEVADIITCSGIHIKNDQQFMNELIDQGKELVIVTNGSKGFKALDKGKKLYQINGFNDFTYVDSNGAGDSFCAGVVSELYRTKDIQHSLEFGNVCGGLACSSEELYHPQGTRDVVLDKLKKSE